MDFTTDLSSDPAFARFCKQLEHRATSSDTQEGETVGQALLEQLREQKSVAAASEAFVRALCDLLPTSNWNDIEQTLERLHGFATKLATAYVGQA
ncbi:MAG: hypothetical protein GX086_06335 [Alcaligenaceae bacterium]|nr:hypothetical protein [Alcaligenaceae bacterium]